MDHERIEKLIQYVEGIQAGENGTELHRKFKAEIESVQPLEIFHIFDKLLGEGGREGDIIQYVDKVVNVFYKSLSTYEWQKPPEDDFINDLMAENTALVSKMDTLKDLIKKGGCSENRQEMIEVILELRQFNEHYIKKENILFPYLEKSSVEFHGLSIMWALHDKVRHDLKESVELLKNPLSGEEEIKRKVGSLIFGMLGVLKKEELILFPVASEVLEHATWSEMYRQSLEYEYALVERERPQTPLRETLVKSDDEAFPQAVFKTETGEMSFSQLKAVFEALPMDMTFVDAEDKVRYFSKPKDRIFPRSAAILGRDVRNCHPPESVYKVLEIIEGFKMGTREKADFWIDHRGHKILIQYFALRDTTGQYLGTLEVSQIVDDIMQLEGEKRLLSE